MGSRWRASKAQQSLDLMAQELGILLLIKRGVRLLTANGDDLCDTSDPSRVMMRQIAGAFAQYEKARLVARLRRAREVKGKMGGRKSLMETRPEVVELARKLRRSRSGKQRSLREISAELAARGFVAERTGRSYEAAQVSRMLAQRTRGAPARKGREVLQDLTQSGRFEVKELMTTAIKAARALIVYRLSDNELWSTCTAP
jgi:Resolvase, N terminal domain